MFMILVAMVFFLPTGLKNIFHKVLGDVGDLREVLVRLFHIKKGQTSDLGQEKGS